MKFLNILITTGLLVGLNACQPVDATQADTETSARYSDDSALIANFETRVQSIQKNGSEFQASSTDLAAQLARFPAPDMQKVLITAPDSQKMTGFSPSLDSAKAQTPLISEHAALLIGVRDYQETRNKINALAAQYQGFINGESEKFTEFRVENTFTLQTPAEHFTTLLEQFKTLAIVVREKKVWREDLAVSWVDVQARVESKTLALRKLQELARTNTNPAQVLPIQRELELVQTDLQALNQSAQSIRKRGLFSQITLTIFQELNRPTPAQAGFNEQILTNLDKGWGNFKTGLIWASAYWVHIAFGLFFVGIWAMFRRSARNTSQHHSQPQPPQPWLYQGKKPL